MQSAAFSRPFSCKKHGYVRHLARVLYQKARQKRQNGVPDATSHPLPPATTPCENRLFAADGHIMAREGSHNVKICAEYFTY